MCLKQPRRAVALPPPATLRQPPPRVKLTQLRAAMNLLAEVFKSATPTIRHS